MNEAQQFIFGLEQCRSSRGMIWYGDIPKEIQELYGVKQKELAHGYTFAGIYVTIKPRYEAYTPAWLRDYHCDKCKLPHDPAFKCQEKK